MGRILFISSYKTGHGHKSITEALGGQISLLDSSIQVDEVDGFLLGGRLSASMSNWYDKVVVHAPLFWKFYYALGNIFPAVANFYIAKSIKKAFCRVVEMTRPDLIVSVHPSFVSSVEDIIEEKGWRIPVIALVADLDNVTRLWADSRSLYTICPTENARQGILKYGIPDKQIKVFGFPVRDRFNHFEPDPNVSYFEQTKGKERLNFLIMNGSQGLGQVIKIAMELLDHFNCNVVILAGNNKKLKAAIENALQEHKDYITVCGFVENVEQYMIASDILLLRASPNVMMEAVNLCKPFIVTGALTGQEEKNPDFAAANHLGVVCKDVSKLAETVNQLLAESGRKLNEVARHQIEYRKLQASLQTAEFLLSVLRENSQGGNNENN